MNRLERIELPRFVGRRPAAWLQRLLLAQAVVLGSMAPGWAAEPYQRFLRGLWARGYGDAAVDYVTGEQARGDLPAEIRITIEMDLARSLRVAADEATSDAAAARRLAAARDHAERFLREHPEHAEAAAANALLGELTLVRGQEIVRSAELADSDEARSALLRQAREQFEAARPLLAGALKQFEDRLAQMPQPRPAEVQPPPAANPNPAHKQPGRSQTKTIFKAPASSTSKTPAAAPAAVKPSPPSPRMLVEEQWLDTKFKSVIIDYWMAQTFGEADAFSRQSALKAAAAGLDDLYQHYRMQRMGLVAHLWHGRVEQQLGNRETALDIFDEVLGIVPEAGDRPLAAGIKQVLGEAQAHRLQLLEDLGQSDAAIEEAQQWLEQFQADRHRPQNLQIALVLCKLKLAKAASLTGDQRRELTQSALATLAEIVKFPGSHQREALELWHQHLAGGEVDQPRATLAEVLEVAAAASRNRLWPEAIEEYGRAIVLARASAQSKQLNSARYELARAQFFGGKLDEAVKTAETLARDPAAGDVARSAAMLAVSAAASRLASAKTADKQAAAASVESLAAIVIGRWPSSSEADEARITLAKLQLARGEDDHAGALLKAIGPASGQYRAALYLTAQACWRMHLHQQKPPTSDGQAAPADALEQQAVSALETLIGLESKDSTGGNALSDSLREALLFLTDIHLAMHRIQRAAPLAERLQASLRLDRSRPLDSASAHTLALVMKIYVADRQLSKAGELAALLLEIGPDERQVNSALVDYVRLVRSQSNSQPAAGSPANSQPPEPLALLELLDKLEARKQFAISEQVFLGTVCRELSRRAQAVELLQAALRQAQRDTTKTSPQAIRALAQLRLQVVDLLREERRYDEASAEADRLLADNPQLLEPLISKARVMQDWSLLTPEKLGDAAAAWMRVRTALQSVQPRPAQYFDAVYNTAECLFRQSHELKDDVKLRQAEQVLKATMVLYPKLHGEESVAKFQQLLERITAARPAQPPAR